MVSKLARALLPAPARSTLRALAKPLLKRARARRLRRDLMQEPRRVVIGASGVFEPGWVPTDSDQLNLLRPESWLEFVQPGSIDVLLAEHVWEHLTLAEGRKAAAVCHRFLKPGGYMRVAVPDGYFPDPQYQDDIRVDGPAGGGPLGGHKVVYTYRELTEVFESAGFETKLLEHHDEQGVFHMTEWDVADGMIHRSKRFDARGPISVILDARKPADAR
jgi:predicted SAM-dependent methyltransferase